jgi:hypothetical protein
MNNIQKLELLWTLRWLTANHLCSDLQFIVKHNQNRILNSCSETAGIFVLGREDIFVVELSMKNEGRSNCSCEWIFDWYTLASVLIHCIPWMNILSSVWEMGFWSRHTFHLASESRPYIFDGHSKLYFENFSCSVKSAFYIINTVLTCTVGDWPDLWLVLICTWWTLW